MEINEKYDHCLEKENFDKLEFFFGFLNFGSLFNEVGDANNRRAKLLLHFFEMFPNNDYYKLVNEIIKPKFAEVRKIF